MCVCERVCTKTPTDIKSGRIMSEDSHRIVVSARSIRQSQSQTAAHKGAAANVTIELVWMRPRCRYYLNRIRNSSGKAEAVVFSATERTCVVHLRDVTFGQEGWARQILNAVLLLFLRLAAGKDGS